MDERTTRRTEPAPDPVRTFNLALEGNAVALEQLREMDPRAVEQAAQSALSMDCGRLKAIVALVEDVLGPMELAS